jgi:hypothetical protein
MTELQDKVFNAAKKRLEKFNWYKGICLNDFPNDSDIKEDFEDAVTQVMMETAYWDAPNFFNLDEEWE